MILPASEDEICCMVPFEQWSAFDDCDRSRALHSRLQRELEELVWKSMYTLREQDVNKG